MATQPAEKPDPSVAELLTEHVAGAAEATAALVPLIYRDLRRLAGQLLRREGRTQTLQPTALVHEAYLRLVGGRDLACNGRTHFFALAARQLRFVLVDHARARKAKKRAALKVTLSESLGSQGEDPLDLIALDEAMESLAAVSPRQSRVIELRCFAGMSVDETAAVLGVSSRTVKSDTRVAQAWLLRALRA